MVTKGDIDKILTDVNRILSKLDERIKVLEEQPKEKIAVTSKTSTKPANKSK